ncbi:ribonuclease H [Trifolium pratense]|uniref:Ribonuclease H n=1 Tax=Trifolium pratense TaxID=57577 RepID=A0A2K3M2J8_TRIPR|nr:ribonuclease H [Trifolium pratense]
MEEVGDGRNIQFWTDEWCGSPLIHTLNIQEQDIAGFPKNVSDYIVDKNWWLPPEVHANYPNLKSLVQHVALPADASQDKLVWKGSADGELTAKIAYDFKRHHYPILSWAKTVWCIDIPPSKSLVAWTLMHDKLPTDENLKIRGCNLPSICSLCYACEESSFHLPLKTYGSCVIEVGILNAKLCGAMSAIEIAHRFHWNQLWIETDSSLVVKAFKNDALIPWKLRNRWSNCNCLLRNMNMLLYHMFFVKKYLC